MSSEPRHAARTQEWPALPAGRAPLSLGMAPAAERRSVRRRDLGAAAFAAIALGLSVKTEMASARSFQRVIGPRRVVTEPSLELRDSANCPVSTVFVEIKLSNDEAMLSTPSAAGVVAFPGIQPGEYEVCIWQPSEFPKESVCAKTRYEPAEARVFVGFDLDRQTPTTLIRSFGSLGEDPQDQLLTVLFDCPCSHSMSEFSRLR